MLDFFRNLKFKKSSSWSETYFKLTFFFCFNFFNIRRKKVFLGSIINCKWTIAIFGVGSGKMNERGSLDCRLLEVGITALKVIHSQRAIRC